jgi:hypothetical protein
MLWAGDAKKEKFHIKACARGILELDPEEERRDGERKAVRFDLFADLNEVNRRVVEVQGELLWYS